MKAFLVGLSAGAIITLLYAPKTGRDTRRYIRRRVDRSLELVERNARRVSRLQQDVRDKSRKTLKRADKAVTAAIHAGRSVASALV
jgi:gas vesicle protein